MQIKICVLVCQLCKNATVGLVLRSKKGFTDSFLKYFLSAYNVPGSCARPEDLMVNKNSPCSHELMVEWARKTFTKKFPQMNTLLQIEIVLWRQERWEGGPRKAEKAMLKFSWGAWEQLDIFSRRGTGWELTAEHDGEAEIQGLEWLVDREPGGEKRWGRRGRRRWNLAGPVVAKLRIWPNWRF